MDDIRTYISQRQDEFHTIIKNLTEKNIIISIDTQSVEIEKHLDSVLNLLNDNLYNAKQNNNIIEILNDRYVINIEFKVYIKFNKIYCSVQLKIKNYHSLCRNSISKDYLFDEYDIFTMSDKKLIDSIKNLFDSINKNYIFCDCVK